jgi:hypothetical protein
LLIMERLRMNAEIKHQWQGVSSARNCHCIRLNGANYYCYPPGPGSHVPRWKYSSVTL